MRYYLLLLTLLLSANVYSQDFLEMNYASFGNIDFKGRVKCINVFEITFNNNYKDSICFNHEVHLNKKGIVRKGAYYAKDTSITNTFTPSETTIFDRYGRIYKVYRKGYLIERRKYSNRTTIPSKFEWYSDQNKKYTIKIVTAFNSKGQPITSSRITNNTLRCYYKYRYNDTDSLSEKIYINTPNGPKITLTKSFTKGKEEIYLYPNDTTTYQYSTAGDTLIRKEYTERGLYKVFKNAKGYRKIETMNNSSKKNRLYYEFIKTYNDSITNDIHIFYSDKNEKSIYTTLETLTKIIRSSINDMHSYREEEEYKHIDYDKYGNWILKQYYKKGSSKAYRTILRKIKYYE